MLPQATTLEDIEALLPWQRRETGDAKRRRLIRLYVKRKPRNETQVDSEALTDNWQILDDGAVQLQRCIGQRSCDGVLAEGVHQ